MVAEVVDLVPCVDLCKNLFDFRTLPRAQLTQAVMVELRAVMVVAEEEEGMEVLLIETVVFASNSRIPQDLVSRTCSALASNPSTQCHPM